MSPISPSISARGTSAATESITMTSTAPERTSMSAISRACSPVSGWETSRSSTFTPSFCGVHRIERVLGVDEGARAAGALDFGDDLQGQRGLARGFRAVDLDDAAARQAADAERDVEAERAGGDGLDVVGRARLAEAHDRALAELLLDLAQRGRQRLLAVVFHCRDLLRGKIDGGLSHSDARLEAEIMGIFQPVPMSGRHCMSCRMELSDSRRARCSRSSTPPASATHHARERPCEPASHALGKA